MTHRGSADRSPPSWRRRFSLSLGGEAASDYSTKLRCGYIRYDHGTFVGDPIVVEARDGQWCHELALEHIELQDRMLLTELSISIEPARAGGSPVPLIARYQPLHGEFAEWIPAEPDHCAYVAHIQPLHTCELVSAPLPCVCPEVESWGGFFASLTLAFRADEDGT